MHAKFPIAPPFWLHMNAGRIFAIVLAALVMCGLCVAAIFWRLESRRPPIIDRQEFYMNPRLPLKACPPVSSGMIVTWQHRPSPREQRIDEFDLGSLGKHRTVFASFGPQGDRSVLFILNGRFVKVEPWFNSHVGDKLGAVQWAHSDVHVHATELCFDLTVESSDEVERWQGRLGL
jgi:hypothetical protein